MIIIEPTMNLTPGRLFCLEYLENAGPATGGCISAAAYQSGLSRRKNREWADKYLPWLRKNGLARKTGRKHLGAAIHEISEDGRRALRACYTSGDALANERAKI